MIKIMILPSKNPKTTALDILSVDPYKNLRITKPYIASNSKAAAVSCSGSLPSLLVEARIVVRVHATLERPRRRSVWSVGLRGSARRLCGSVRGEGEARERGDQKGVGSPGSHRKSHYR